MAKHSDELEPLLTEVRACRLCRELPLGPRPILQADPAARILIAGQAPGRRAHERGVPFDDPSGDRLREWLGVDRERFYDPRCFAILPMAFCYPGSSRGGDLPPRPECAPAWRRALLERLPSLRLTLVIGLHAQRWHLPAERGRTVGAVVTNWHRYWPELVPMPHPSPRNAGWLQRHPAFERELLPALRLRVRAVLQS